jgi:hypothetical protein
MSPKLLNILLVLIPVVLYFGYLDPVYTGQPGIIFTPEANITSLQSTNVQYADALNQIALVQSEIEKVNKDYNAIDPAIKNKVTILLPDTIDVVKLRNEVMTIANKSGVAIYGLSVKNNPRNRDPDLDQYTVNFSMKAHYSDIKGLLANFEKNMRLYVIDSVRINRPEKRAGDAPSLDDGETLTGTVSFNVYSLKKK